MPPEIADRLLHADWDLARVQRYLYDSRNPYPYEGLGELDGRPLADAPEDIHPIVTGGVGIKMTYLPLWAGGTATVTRALRAI